MNLFTGFHDAIGDAISLSITPKHLQSLGLIQKSIDDTAHDINFLFSLAMDKVSEHHQFKVYSTQPFMILIDVSHSSFSFHTL